jgi:hypothetical protein
VAQVTQLLQSQLTFSADFNVLCKLDCSCIHYLKFFTTKKQTLAIGKNTTDIAKLPKNKPEEYVFGFAGSAGGECNWVLLVYRTSPPHLTDCRAVLPPWPQFGVGAVSCDFNIINMILPFIPASRLATMSAVHPFC